jgi:hypothetical protein
MGDPLSKMYLTAGPVIIPKWQVLLKIEMFV